MPAAPGRIVVLNGAPRAGKSSIARALQARSDGIWLNLGVDAFAVATPPRLLPGIGLRPGGGMPEVAAAVPLLYAALYEAVAAASRVGLDVVVDVGHHEESGAPAGILADCARRLAGLPAYLVGVRCPVPEIMARRRAVQPGREGLYVAAAEGEPVPGPVLAWERAVHEPGIYDLELDTSALGPEACAAAILHRLDDPAPPTAFARLAAAEAPLEASGPKP
jgi:chloramphenicol 3-O phosphotransferase